MIKTLLPCGIYLLAGNIEYPILAITEGLIFKKYYKLSKEKLSHLLQETKNVLDKDKDLPLSEKERLNKLYLQTEKLFSSYYR